MGFSGLLALLVIAVLCAAAVQGLSEWSIGGALTALVFGFIGAVGGVWAAGHWRLPDLLPFRVGGESFPVVWALLGAFVLASTIGMLSRDGARR